MQTVALRIESEQTAEKIRWLLSHFEIDGVQMVDLDEIEPICKSEEDYKLFQESKNSETVLFDTYLKNENRDF